MKPLIGIIPFWARVIASSSVASFSFFVRRRVKRTGNRKGDAIKAVLEEFGLKKEESISFGDDLQDISMGEASCLVCLGNGREEVKKEADFVTDEIWNDGVKHALEHFGIL